MSELVVKVDGLGEIKAKLEDLREEFRDKALHRGVAAAARLVRNAARARVPVRTGLLRNALRYGKDRQASLPGKAVYNVFVSPKIQGPPRGKKQKRSWAFYWRFVEFGTSKMPARPFLRPAIAENREAALNAMKAAWEKAIAKYR